MTSLLDPAQIEERERRRLKQLEQQRAIEAQMEERRKQREQEEARRRREEEEEEKRVALEREKQQKQYELEMQKRKKKDPVPQEEQPEDSRPEDTSEPRATTRLALCMENGFSSSPCYKDSSVQTEDTTAPPPTLPLSADRVQTPDVSVENHTPPPDSAEPPNSSSHAARADKKNIRLTAGEDQYELFARTERRRRTKTRPEWNTQRPSRRFVPASERYPVALQRNRQESRLRRQAELLALQERTRLTRADPNPQNQEARLCPDSQQTRTNPVKKVDSSSSGFRGQNPHHTVTSADRGRSPPVPAIKPEVESLPTSCSPPLALEFIPYLRTAEVFSLDPLEPADTPPPRTHPGPPPPTESSASSRDPLLHPEVVRNSQRQQEILRGLAQLRQGLLQKRRELETDLNRRDIGQRTASSAHRTADGGGVRSTAQLMGTAK